MKEQMKMDGGIYKMDMVKNELTGFLATINQTGAESIKGYGSYISNKNEWIRSGSLYLLNFDKSRFKLNLHFEWIN